MVLQGILRSFSRGISYLTHPLILPVCSVVFISSLPGYLSAQVAPFRWMLVLLVFLFTVLIPVLLMGMLRSVGRISTLQMEDRAERTIPYLLTGIVYYLAYRYFLRMGLPPVYALILLSATALVLVAMLINLRWKVSLHMMGIGGALGLLHGLAPHFPGAMFLPTVVLVAIGGMLAFARLFLGSHRQGEVYGGFGVGYLLFLVIFSQLM